MSKSVAQKQIRAKRELNIEWLKSFEGFENYSEQQAEQELSSLKKLAELVCRHLINTS